MKSTKLPVTSGAIYETKGPKSLLPVDTKTNVNLKISTQKTDVIDESRKVIKYTIVF